MINTRILKMINTDILLLLVLCECFRHVKPALDDSSRNSCTRAFTRVTVKYNDTLQKGVATSPEYPQNYPLGLNCTYRLEVSNGYRMVVTFENFTMETMDGQKDCNHDFIILRDGFSEAGSRFIGRFCGNDKPKPFLSSGRFVWIFFVSNNRYTYRGFKVTFKPKHEAVIATCTQQNTQMTLFGADGNISSPSYPGLYPVHRTCHWTLTAPQGYFVNLTFITFETQCPNDKLTIRDINAGGQRLGEHCGKTLLPFYQGRQLSVLFLSDETFADDEHGFYAIYEMVPFNRSIEERCLGGQHLSLDAQEGGTIQSPWYSYLYPNDIDCRWNILAPEGEHVRISVEAFDLEDTSECTADYLEFGDPSVGEKHRFCGGDKPKVFESAGEIVQVRFKTDGTTRARGFVARYDLSRAGCNTLPCVRTILLSLLVIVGTLHSTQSE